MTQYLPNNKTISLFYTLQLPLAVTDMTALYFENSRNIHSESLMYIGPCIIVIVEEWRTNLMSLVILFHFLCAQHVSDINISIIRSLRLCLWIITSVVLFSVRCVLELLVRLFLGGFRFAGFSLQNEHHSKPAAPNLQHTTNWEQKNRCGNSTTQSQAPDDGYINVRNMFST